MKTKRNSNMELLRICAMLMIVAYHLYSLYYLSAYRIAINGGVRSKFFKKIMYISTN